MHLQELYGSYLEEDFLSEVAYCWRQGYRYLKIKEHLNNKSFIFYIDKDIVSKIFHYIADNGGLKVY